MSHPCDNCPARPEKGLVACPIAAAIINRHRCSRVTRMAPEKALANLYGLWQRHWKDSKAQGDKAQKKLLAWASRNELRIWDIWETLKASEQILTLENPLISRPRRAARRRAAGPQ